MASLQTLRRSDSLRKTLPALSLEGTISYKERAISATGFGASTADRIESPLEAVSPPDGGAAQKNQAIKRVDNLFGKRSSSLIYYTECTLPMRPKPSHDRAFLHR